MSLGWKKFSFFDKEDRSEADVPENVSSSTSGGGWILFGCTSGEVVGLDRSLKEAFRFQAHQHRIDALTFLKARSLYLQRTTVSLFLHLYTAVQGFCDWERVLQKANVAVTVGRDGAALSSWSVKFWNFSGLRLSEGQAPPCMSAAKLSTNGKVHNGHCTTNEVCQSPRYSIVVSVVTMRQHQVVVT
jgi:hypothetical protein